MPGFDGTGPFGSGPFTGKGRGDCVVQEDFIGGKKKIKDGRAVFLPGEGRTAPAKAGLAAGRCAGQYPYAPESFPEEEACILKNREKALKRQLECTNLRIEALEKIQFD